MKKEALPYYPFHWRDFRANRKVRRMNYIERGLYRELLDECWAEGFISNDIGKLADICDCPEQVLANAWQVLAPCFTEVEPGILINERMQAERTAKDSERAKRAISGARGGTAKSTSKQVLANANKCLESESKCHIAEQSIAEQKQSASNPNTPEVIPEGLDPFQYATGVLEKIGLPSSRSLLQIVASSIQTLAKDEREPLTLDVATERIIARVLADKRSGKPVNRFWFEDGKFNSGSASSEGSCNRQPSVAERMRNLAKGQK